MLSTYSVSPFDDLFSHLLNKPTPGLSNVGTKLSWEAQEENGVFVLAIEVPGASSESLEVTADNKHLSVEGTRRSLLPKADPIPVSKRWLLPEDSDLEAMTADLEDGVLRVTIPKRQEARLRKIPLKGMLE
jgi:HSP20 family protein